GVEDAAAVGELAARNELPLDGGAFLNFAERLRRGDAVLVLHRRSPAREARLLSRNGRGRKQRARKGRRSKQIIPLERHVAFLPACHLCPCPPLRVFCGTFRLSYKL